MIGRFVRVAVIALVVIFSVLFVLQGIFRGSLFDHYLNSLDAWVKGGGNVTTVQADVVTNCGKLVLSQVGTLQSIKFLTYQRDDFDFYVDVCAKMTVNRVHKQPEFEKPEIVKAICGASSERFLQELCRRSGL